jgi:hypothetical protein
MLPKMIAGGSDLPTVLMGVKQGSGQGSDTWGRLVFTTVERFSCIPHHRRQSAVLLRRIRFKGSAIADPSTISRARSGKPAPDAGKRDPVSRDEQISLRS